MTAGVLDVLIAGKLAGTLSQDGAGSLSFAYERGYRGVPLSSSMPLSTRPYRDKVVLPYLWGLLPEDPAVRRHVAADAGISPNNPFALLGVIGLDCPGAVQFVLQGSDAYRDERLVAVSDAEIARRLATGRQDGAGWIASDEHWSLGGQQSKFALRRMDGKWYSCEGSAATTHILKSGVRGLAHQALNEYVCMRLAASLDVPAASVEYLEFEGESGVEPAIVIERYDRLVEGDNVTRLHQEDLCQALGCLPDNKYTMYGGPNCAEVLGLLTSTGPTAQANAAGFLQMLFLNYLLAATDAHAKNYSIMLAADGSHRLAPMYDVASIAPYVEGAKLRVKPPRACHVHRRREPRRPCFGKRPRQAGRAVRPRTIRHNRRGLPRLVGALRQRDSRQAGPGVRRFGENGVGRRRQGAQGAHGETDRTAVRKVAERTVELSTASSRSTSESWGTADKDEEEPLGMTPRGTRPSSGGRDGGRLLDPAAEGVDVVPQECPVGAHDQHVDGVEADLHFAVGRVDREPGSRRNLEVATRRISVAP